MHGETSPKTLHQKELLYNRLVKRFRHLRKWARRTETNSFRLYDRDIPEIPLVLDLYDDAVSGALYRKTRTDAMISRDEDANLPADPIDDIDAEEAWLRTMRSAITEAVGVPEHHIFLKKRKQMRNRHDSGVQYSKVAEQSFYRDVREGSLTFRVNLSDYLDTGLFLDSRKKRALIQSESAGKRVLNLFAYTCSLSVCAAKGGAVHVDSVDMSNTYLDWGRINVALNKLDAEYNDEHLTLIRSDVLLFIEEARRNRRRWDSIILDPPSFSNSKKMRGTLDIRRDLHNLVDDCLTLLSPKGTLYVSSNAKGINLSGEDFPRYTVKDIRPSLIDEDFKDKRIPACYMITRS